MPPPPWDWAACISFYFGCYQVSARSHSRWMDYWGKGIKMPFHFEQDTEALERKKHVRSLGLRPRWGLLLCSDLFFTPPGLWNTSPHLWVGNCFRPLETRLISSRPTQNGAIAQGFPNSGPWKKGSWKWWVKSVNQFCLLPEFSVPCAFEALLACRQVSLIYLSLEAITQPWEFWNLWKLDVLTELKI